MSVSIHCDGCGLEVEEEDRLDRMWVAVMVEDVEGEQSPRHYHLACWDEVSDYLDFNRRIRRELALLPVCEEPPEPGARDLDIDQLPMHPAAVAALRDAGIVSVAQLVERTPFDLLDLKGIGWTRLEAIEGALAVRGLWLRAPAEQQA